MYLVFSRDGFVPGRATKKPPRVGAGQYAIRVNLTVPDRLFQPAIPDLNVSMPEGAALAPAFQARLEDMDDVCMNTRVVRLPRSSEANYRCPVCGYETWSDDPGPHYKPGPAHGGKTDERVQASGKKTDSNVAPQTEAPR